MSYLLSEVVLPDVLVAGEDSDDPCSLRLLQKVRVKRSMVNLVEGYPLRQIVHGEIHICILVDPGFHESLVESDLGRCLFYLLCLACFQQLRRYNGCVSLLSDSVLATGERKVSFRLRSHQSSACVD